MFGKWVVQSTSIIINWLPQSLLQRSHKLHSAPLCLWALWHLLQGTTVFLHILGEHGPIKLFCYQGWDPVSLHWFCIGLNDWSTCCCMLWECNIYLRWFRSSNSVTGYDPVQPANRVSVVFQTLTLSVTAFCSIFPLHLLWKHLLFSVKESVKQRSPE